MKNIFVEGIQGAGKSALVNGISKAVPGMHVCREGDYSPVDLAWCTWMSKEEYHAALERYAPIRDEIMKNTVQEQGRYVIPYTKIITDIPRFHKEMENYEVYNGRKPYREWKEIIISRYRKFSETGYLFECAFFQNIIEDLILFHLVDDDGIMDFYRVLYEQIHKEQFLLLYLYSDNLEENIRAIQKERCDNLGNELWYPMMLSYLGQSPYGVEHGCCTFEDMISHFRHRQRLEMSIIREIIKDNAYILPAREWKMDEIMPMLQPAVISGNTAPDIHMHHPRPFTFNQGD